jgi:hypothetical protein
MMEMFWMTTAFTQKQQLIARLRGNPVPHEREHIERQLSEMNTALVERKRVAAEEGAKALQEVHYLTLRCPCCLIVYDAQVRFAPVEALSDSASSSS